MISGGLSGRFSIRLNNAGKLDSAKSVFIYPRSVAAVTREAFVNFPKIESWKFQWSYFFFQYSRVDEIFFEKRRLNGFSMEQKTLFKINFFQLAIEGFFNQLKLINDKIDE